MITLQFAVRLPWTDRWDSLFQRWGKLGRRHAWEFEVSRCNELIGLDCRYTVRQSHAGLLLSLSLLGWEAMFTVYDIRHWDTERNCWIDLPRA